uniref:Retrotransposon protein, putative, Ty3-gypsy subclass n=1 Tax=Oryza sativa subsp. japonica TaxID=39947 RepID=Q2R095_ORYSJ|nr:retrotransposon protein, putative, Ty3-gypsy subclass [Oryza sativa Japonica Group]
MAETRPRAGGALEMTKPEEVAAQVGVDRRGGATRLDSAVAAERDGERGGGVPGAGRGNGVGAGVRRGTAMPMAVVAQRGSDGSGGGARLEVTSGGCGSGAWWMWCFGGVLWKRSGGRLGEEKSWPDVADLKRQRPATWVTSWAKWGSIRHRFWRGKVGEESGGGGATRSRGRGERAGGGGGGICGDVGRPWRRFRLREPEVRDGPDRSLFRRIASRDDNCSDKQKGKYDDIDELEDVAQVDKQLERYQRDTLRAIRPQQVYCMGFFENKNGLYRIS